MLRKCHGGLYQAPTMVERRKRKAKRRERDQMKFIDLRFEIVRVPTSRKARGRQNVPLIKCSWEILKISIAPD